MEQIKTSTLDKLLPALKILRKEEKLFIIQFLASELAQQEGASLMPNLNYPVWSPHASYQAADTLLQMLNEPSP